MAQKITVLALSMNTNYRAPAGLDDDPKTTASGYKSLCGEPGGTTGQGTRIANATGGKLVQGVSASTIVETITAELATQVTVITNVRLVPNGTTVGFVKVIAPINGYGPLSQDQDQEITFDVSWLGNVPCSSSPQVFSGSVDVVADGQIIGAKTVKITVPSCIPPLPPINPEEENPMPRPDDVSGSWMFIHQVTGTYLETDSTGCNINEAVQTWHNDPLYTNAGVLVKQTDGTYLIRSWQKNPAYQEELYLQASTNTKTNLGDAFPRLQRRSNDELQSWILIPVSGDPDTYAIQPKLFPDYALGIYINDRCTDRYVVANRTWGKPTFHHYWRLWSMRSVNGRIRILKRF